jgi:hypothetical protein
MGDLAALRFESISSREKQKILESLPKKAIPFDVTAIISSTEGRLRDGRVLRLAYLVESASLTDREGAQSLLNKLLVDSGFVVFAVKRSADDPGPQSIIEDTAERVTAVVSVHTGKMIVSDVGMLLLENRLAAVDLQSPYAENRLYKMEEEYLRTGRSAF